MQATLDHPAARIDYRLPAGLAIAPLLPPWMGPGVARRHILIGGDAPMAQLLVLTGADFAPLQRLSDFAGLVAVRGTLSGVSPRTGGEAGGSQAEVDFLLDGIPQVAVIQRVALWSGAATVSVFVAVWGGQERAQLVRDTLAELVRELRVQAQAPRSAALARTALLLALGTNMLAALVSLLGGVPIYALHSRPDAPSVLMSLLMLAVFVALAIGVIRRRTWGVMGTAIFSGVLAVSGTIFWILVEASRTSSYRVIIPALSVGGIHGLLWTLCLFVNFAALPIALIARTRLIDE
jgi:hypothetical protein